MLLRRSHLTPCLGRCGGALKNFILNNLKYDILQSIWRMWPCIRPVEAPGWLLACKVPSVVQVILMSAVCGSLWRVFSMLQPSSPFGSKAIRWMEKPVQAKKHVTSIPKPAQPWFVSSRPGNRLPWGEAKALYVGLSGHSERCFGARCCGCAWAHADFHTLHV